MCVCVCVQRICLWDYAAVLQAAPDQQLAKGQLQSKSRLTCLAFGRTHYNTLASSDSEGQVGTQHTHTHTHTNTNTASMQVVKRVRYPWYCCDKSQQRFSDSMTRVCVCVLLLHRCVCMTSTRLTRPWT